MTFPRTILKIALLTTAVLASTAGGLAQEPALPSGLTPVSELAVGGSQLALDANGSLFRLDHGKHWKQVHQQWQGKAVELLGIPALTEAPKSGQAPRSSADQEAFAAVLLKSTAALHWISVDQGKTWKPSTLDDVRRNDVHWSGY
jgi:hypothetical protein